MRKFYALKREGKMDQATIDEWMKDTPKKLPERVKKANAKVTVPLGMALGALAGTVPGYLLYRNPVTGAPFDEKQRKKNMLIGAAAGAAGGGFMGHKLSPISGEAWKSMYDTLIRGRPSEGFQMLREEAPIFKGRGLPAPLDMGTTSEILGLTGSETTKKEVRKKFIDWHKTLQSMKGDPRVYDGTRVLNMAYESVKKSPWFKKLAEEEKEEGYFQRIPQAAEEVMKKTFPLQLGAAAASILPSFVKENLKDTAGLFARGGERRGVDILLNLPTDKRLSKEDRHRLLEGMSFFTKNPISAEGGGVMNLATKSSPASTLESLGKALSSKARPGSPVSPYVRSMIPSLLSGAGLLAGVTMASSDDETVQKAAPYVVAAGAAVPALMKLKNLAVGTHEVGKQLGGMKALKALAPNLPGALLSSAVPVAAFLGAQKFIKKPKKEMSKKADGNYGDGGSGFTGTGKGQLTGSLEWDIYDGVKNHWDEKQQFENQTDKTLLDRERNPRDSSPFQLGPNFEDENGTHIIY